MIFVVVFLTEFAVILFFSSEVPYVSVNCKVHYPEDIIGWQPAKTVWQNMQMRALGVVLKNGIGFYGRCMADVWESRLFFQCFFSQFFTMQPIFFMIFLLYYCTDVKTVKCTIQRTSSAGSLRKPSDKSCRCAHLSAPWVEADFITQGITHWVKTMTTTSTVWCGPNGRFPYCTVVLAASKLRQKWLKMGWSEHLYRYLLFVRASVGQKN